MTSRQQIIMQAQRELEGSRLSMAAYSAKSIVAALNDYSGQPRLLEAKLVASLVKEGFTPDQAHVFAARYTPVAALDQEGVGGVIFRDNTNGKLVPTTRGTDVPANTVADLVQADGSIAQSRLPTHQTTVLLNWLLREATPAGQPVAQLKVQGVGSGADDLVAATMGTMLPASPLNTPRLSVVGTALGTGRAVGTYTDIVGHSEGAPESFAAGAILGYQRVTVVNGPGVSGSYLQQYVDQARDLLGKPRVAIDTIDSLSISTSGPSVIDGLNGGIPGAVSVLPIDWSANPVNAFDNHSSKTAMNAAELRLKIIQSDPSITSLEQANTALIKAQREQNGTGQGSALMGSTDPLGNYQPSADLSSTPATGALGTKPASTPPDLSSLPQASYSNEGRNYPDPSNYSNEGRAYLNIGNTAASTDTSTPASTVFNPTTALPTYSGQQGVTVQSGDTITAIAQRYGMDAGEYTAFLQQHYGPGADLDSIVAGRRLPLPAEVYERTQGGINGLDSTEPANASAPGSSSAPTASTPPAEPPVDNSKPSIQNPSSSQQVEFESSPPTNPANEPAQQTQDQATEQTSISLVQLTQSAALLSSVVGLQHWGALSEVQRLASLSGLYNQLDHIGSLGSHDNLPGDLGSAAAAFNLLASLEHGNTAGVLMGGLNLTNVLADNMASEAIHRTCQRRAKRRCASNSHRARNAL